MDRLLEKVKARISQQGSPIRTVRGVAEALDMSESGFYRMVERGALKRPKLIALSKALGVKESYFSEKPEPSEDMSVDNGQYTLEGVVNQIKILHEQLQMKDRQLEVKDQQIAGLQRTVDALVGKSEGATVEPHFADPVRFEEAMNLYQKYVLKKIIEPATRSISPVAMLVAPR